MTNPIEAFSESPPLDREVGTLCLSCGYNLHGLDPSGCCPECGIAVAESRRGSRLVYADRAWVRSLYRGTQCLYWTIVGLIVTPLLAGTLSFTPAGATVSAVLAAVSGLVFMGLFVLGAWWITEPDPRVSIVEPQWSRRRLVRVAGGVALVALLARGVLPAALHPYANGVCLIGGYAALIGCLRELQDIAARIPDAKAQKRARARVRELTVVLVVFVLLVGWHRLARQPGAALGAYLRITKPLASLVTLVLGLATIMALDTLTRFRSDLKKVVVAAASEPPEPR